MCELHLFLLRGSIDRTVGTIVLLLNVVSCCPDASTYNSTAGEIPMMEVCEDVRTCTRCYHLLPATEFTRRRKGTNIRQPVCKSCHAAERRALRKRHRDRRLYQYAKEVINAKRSRNRVVALTDRLFKQFGGVEKIAVAWNEAYRAARNASRHLVASKLLLAPLDLYVVSLELERERRGDLDDLSDAELEHLHTQQQLTLRILANRARTAAEETFEGGAGV